MNAPARKLGPDWIIDPGDETLTDCRWTRDGYMEVLLAERADVVRAEPFEAVPLKVGFIFGDDDDESNA
jgi:hypothetical protein